MLRVNLFNPVKNIALKRRYISHWNERQDG
jgi:hypothetical protein